MVDCVITAMVRKVFPEGTEIYLDSENGRSAFQYWIIPTLNGEPKWILPDDSKHVWSFLQPFRPYKRLSRIKWKILLTAYRQNFLGLVPGVIPLRVILPEGNMWDHLGWSLPGQPGLAIYIGTPGQNRKAVLSLIDLEKNKILSIAKLPLGAVAGPSICHEADILQMLAQEKPGCAPRNLFVDYEKGIASQEFYSGSPTSRNLSAEHLSFLLNMVIPEETISLKTASAEMETEIKAFELEDPKSVRVLEGALSDLDDDTPLPAVWEHGDFAPWNIKKRNDGSLGVIDWEAASRKAIPLFDLLFFQWSQTFLFGEQELFPKSFRAHLKHYLETLEIAPKMTCPIIKACIVKDWIRWNKTGDHLRANFLLHTLSLTDLS